VAGEAAASGGAGAGQVASGMAIPNARGRSKAAGDKDTGQVRPASTWRGDNFTARQALGSGDLVWAEGPVRWLERVREKRRKTSI